MSISLPGVYALRHRDTGSLYIGSTLCLEERRKAWFHKLNTREVPMRMREITSSRYDWDFVVLWAGQATSDELDARERDAVSTLRQKAPERCLNAIAVSRGDATLLTADGRTMSQRAWSKETGIPRTTIAVRLRRGCTPEQAIGLAPIPTRERVVEQELWAVRAAKVLVLDGDEVLSRREAAAELGCGVKTLAERLQRYQLPEGQARVQLRDLKVLSEKYRRR